MAKTEWSGIGNTYRVRLVDHDEDLFVTTILADAVRWERIMKRAFIGGDPPGFAGVATLLWIALRRTGQISSKDREGWIMTVSDFGVDETDDEDSADEDDEDGSDPLG